MPEEDDDFDDTDFRDAEEDETSPEEDNKEEPDDEEDDEDPESTPLEETKPIVTDEEFAGYADMLLERYEKINDPIKEDWYRALFSVEMDKTRGDVKQSISKADEMYAMQPDPPQFQSK